MKDPNGPSDIFPSDTRPEEETRTYAESEAPAEGLGEFRRGAVLGRFVVIEPLGAGGMGLVYSAFDPQLDRKVAIKILHPEQTDSSRRGEARRRILREAQALAKLRHPNVLTIFEVDSRGDEVFLATELVEGRTLKEWLRTERTLPEILGVFHQAGEGLAAAHRAGVVHRDFKPSNLMIGDDGRAVVLDFGLARSFAPHQTRNDLSDPDGADPDRAAPGETEPGTTDPHGARSLKGDISGPLDRTLTEAGWPLGTPAYMSPEQRRGDSLTGATDQYSFCLSLLEALSGQSVLTHGSPTPSIDEMGIPRRLSRVLKRGLSTEPGNRFPSMDELLVELRQAVASRWGALRLPALGLAAVLAGLWLFSRDSDSVESLCTAGSAKIEEIWNEERRRKIREVASGSDPSSGGSPAHTLASLGSYGAKWIETYTATCEATHRRGEQSPELLDLRMGCLEQRRREYAALIDVLEEGEGLGKAAQAVSRLRPVVDCADAATLAALVRPSLTSDQAQQVDELRSSLARAEALTGTGRFEESLELTTGIADQARALGDWALLAETRLAVGLAHTEAGAGEEAERFLVESALAAKVARHDRVAAEALTALVGVAEYLNDETERAESYAEHAAALIDQMGRPAVLKSQLLTHTAMLRYNAGQFDQAREQYGRALGLIRNELGLKSPQAANLLTRLGNIAGMTGDLHGSVPLFEEALEIAESIYGPEHLECARILSSFGNILKTLGQYERALEAQGRALGIAQRSLGTHFRVANLMTSLGSVYLDMDQPAEALGLYEQARPIYIQTLGEDHPIYSIFLTNVGLAHVKLGNPEEALRSIRRARDMKRRIFGIEDPRYAESTLSLADALAVDDQPRSALGYYQEAAAIVNQAFDGGHYLKADASQGIGVAWLDLNRPDNALPHLESAYAMRLEIKETPLLVATSQFDLARALLAGGGDRKRALELAEAAQRTHRDAGNRGQKNLAAINIWLETHGSEADQAPTSPDSNPSAKRGDRP